MAKTKYFRVEVVVRIIDNDTNEVVDYNGESKTPKHDQNWKPAENTMKLSEVYKSVSHADTKAEKIIDLLQVAVTFNN